MLRFWLGGKARERALSEAMELARARLATYEQKSDAELLALQGVQAERVNLGRVKAKVVAWHESEKSGSHLFMVQVWGVGFVMGGWLLACDGFRLGGGKRLKLTEDELREEKW